MTLPLSMPGILAGVVLIALPMFGDYYTPDLVSASPNTSMIGNQIDQFTRQGSQKTIGAVLTVLLAAVLLIFMLYYLRQTRRAGAARAGRELAPKPVGTAALPPDRHRALHLLVDHPGGDRGALRLQRRALADDLAGLLDALVPGDAGQRARRSGAPLGPPAHPPPGRALRRVAVPLGVALALGLQRWRGLGSGPVNTLMLLPLVTPELVMGVALLLLFLQIFNGWGSGRRPRRSGR